MQKLIDKIRAFKPKKILVVGDLMLDQYTFGVCERKCPEGPHLILDVTEEIFNPGGAGNTAVNLRTLGAAPYLIGIVGRDYFGEIFKQQLEEKKISSCGVLSSQYSKTIRKERPIAEGQQIGPRIDRNDKIPAREEHYKHILEKFSEFLPSSDIVVISDYAKGTLSEDLIAEIIDYTLKSKKQIVIDPKPQHVSAYRNASFITPNFKEACELLGVRRDFSLENAKELAKGLYSRINSSVVLTLSENGILFYAGKEVNYYKTFKRGVKDVSGAGDTVVAALAVGLANGLDINEAIYFSNHAGGVKVEKPRVQPVCLEEIVEDIKRHNNLL